jgi:hypothetical protein
MNKFEGEAEDRVVAGSSPARGTTMLFWHKPATVHAFPKQLGDKRYCLYSIFP